jgi:hypothetical protein
MNKSLRFHKEKRIFLQLLRKDPRIIKKMTDHGKKSTIFHRHVSRIFGNNVDQMII